MKEQNGKIELDLDNYLELRDFKKNIDEGRGYMLRLNIEKDYYDHWSSDRDRVTTHKWVAFTKDEIVEKLNEDIEKYKSWYQNSEHTIDSLKQELKQLPPPSFIKQTELKKMSIWKFLKLRREARK